jgi:hypothetical protein
MRTLFVDTLHNAQNITLLVGASVVFAFAIVLSFPTSPRQPLFVAIEIVSCFGVKISH